MTDTDANPAEHETADDVAEMDSRADTKAIGIIFLAAVAIAIYGISGWTPFI